MARVGDAGAGRPARSSPEPYAESLVSVIAGPSTEASRTSVTLLGLFAARSLRARMRRKTFPGCRRAAFIET